MTKRRRRWLIGVAAAVVLLLAADVVASFAVRSRHVGSLLTARLEAAFGRPVHVGSYSFSLWAGPGIEADSVTVAEDPRFGREYFLRAQSVSATFRWTSLLLGRLQFGSFSLSSPTLNVVDVGGRWNLEDWLPPAKFSGAGTRSGIRSGAPRLYRIDIEDGRINFEHGLDKLPFALIDVNGSVDQSAPGRWSISLAAQPMRAAVNLQDAGTLHLSGQVGGTTARLRPASIELRWPNASLSDVLRLAFGYDYGVRGRQDLRLRAGSRDGRWRFELDADIRGVHRWDFVSEPGNPNLNVRLAGDWSPGQGKLTFTGGQIAAPSSLVALSGGIDWPVAGSARPAGAPSGPRLHLHVRTSGIGAQDLLAWYRSFHEGISSNLRASGWLQGALDVDGWPPRIHNASFTAAGLRVAGGGLRSPVRVSSADLKLNDGKASLLLSGLDFGPRMGSFRVEGSATDIGAWKYRLIAAGSSPRLGALARASETLGARLSGYWKDFSGPGKLRFEWTGTLRSASPVLRASLDLRHAVWREPSLPGRVRLDRARVSIDGSRLRVDVLGASTLGAHWQGWLDRRLPGGEWHFNLSSDRLDVRSLVARLQPRPLRPSLLERIFGFGHAAGSPPLWLATLDAAGRMRVARLAVPPLVIRDVSGRLVIQHGRLELSRATGRFYGGSAHGLLVFSVSHQSPVWHLSANLRGADLAAISRAVQRPKAPLRFSGRLYATVDASASGATAAALLHSLDGEARLSVFGGRDRGINWFATLAAGHPVAGRSLFREASAQIRLASGRVTFDKLRLSGPRRRLDATGTIDLSGGAALHLKAQLLPAGTRSGPARSYSVTGSPSHPHIHSADR